MQAPKKQFETVDDYIAKFNQKVQKILKEIRQTNRDSAPNAKETISYQIPTYKLNGNLVHFAAYENHIGFYPTPSALKEFKKELSQYDIGKGTIKLPIDEPIPIDLIKRLVKFRVNENLAKK